MVLGLGFSGWSDNPNQLSILCVIVVLVALHLADTATSRKYRLAAILFMIPPLVVVGCRRATPSCSR